MIEYIINCLCLAYVIIGSMLFGAAVSQEEFNEEMVESPKLYMLFMVLFWLLWPLSLLAGCILKKMGKI